MGYSPTQYMEFGGVGYGQVGATAEALPDHQEAKAVMVRAFPGNSGNLFVGQVDVVTATAAGTDNETTGFVCDAGQDTPWIPCPPGGLDQISVIGSAASQDYSYIWLK